MFENTKDFYPTPYNLIEKMLSTVNFYMIKSILEPSAGKGDIVDAIRKKTAPQSRWDQEPRLDIDCIEINSDLRHIFFLSSNQSRLYLFKETVADWL